MGYQTIDDKLYLFLRGYGPQEFNRYAVSVYCPDVNKILFDILDNSKHPTDFEHDILYNICKLNFSKQLYIHFMYYLFLAEDAGFYKRAVSKIGLNVIKQGKTPQNAWSEMQQYQWRIYKNDAQKLFEKIENDFKVVKYASDRDAAVSEVLSILHSTEKSELVRLYKDLYWNINNTKAPTINDHYELIEKPCSLFGKKLGYDY
jgi:hypothetical protein